MASTTYTDFQAPAVNAAWLNDTNTAVYTTVPSHTTTLTTHTTQIAAIGSGVTPVGALAGGVAGQIPQQSVAGVTTFTEIPLSIAEGRLTLTSATPVTTADVLAATILYYSEYKGNRVAVYTGTYWKVVKFANISLALTGYTANLPYDIFVYDNAGVTTLESAAWTNTTTRATALVYQDGVLCKSGALTRRYLGTICTTATIGQCEDSVLRRFVWNYYNRVARSLSCTDATASWAYTTATWRQANGAVANKVEMVVGVSEDSVSADVVAYSANTVASTTMQSGVGVNSITAPSGRRVASGAVVGSAIPSLANYSGPVVTGYNYLAWLEHSQAAGVTTWGGNGITGLSATMLA